ncbi:hypothetical protein ACYPKM_00825 [Pseudomonas aeruginosa]
MGTKKVDLEWGQTPFDKLSREELLLHCSRLYSATRALQSTLAMLTAPMKSKDFASLSLEKGRQALAKVDEGFSQESIYKAYYRYADDLLFENTPKVMVGEGWVLCPKCQGMYGGGSVKEGTLCNEAMPAPNNPCDGLLRKLEWSDLQPLSVAEAGQTLD